MRCAVAALWPALLFALLVTAGCATGEPETGGKPQPLTPAESKLLARAPALGKASFGPRAEVTLFTPSWLLGESRVLDETMYAIYNTEQSPYQEIGVVSHGVLHPIRLGGEYYSLSFRNGDRLLSAVRPNGQVDWYAVSGRGLAATTAPASPAYSAPPHVLADGDECSDGLAGSGSALDEIRNHRRVSILSPAAMLRATAGLLDRATQVSCDYFDGRTYATLDKLGVIMRLDGDRATLVGGGWIQAASEHHMLVTTHGRTMVEADARR